MVTRPALGTPQNPLKISLDEGFTADDLAAAVKKHHKTIEGLGNVSGGAHVLFEAGKNVGGRIAAAPSPPGVGKNVGGRGSTGPSRPKKGKVVGGKGKAIGAPPGKNVGGKGN